MKRLFFYILLCSISCGISAQTETIELKFIETSDIHGNYFPFDYIEQQESKGGLSRVHTYVEQQRTLFGENLLLFDNGDILDGQPSVYYYNYMDTVSAHLCGEVMNYMRYDAGNFGNHDIETGEAVMNRWARQCAFPILCANLLQKSDNSIYTQPYAVYEREGVRIAVLGLTTAATPAWVCKSLWENLYFEEMEEAAQKWMRTIREKEKPDIVIGLFHSGKDTRILSDRYTDDFSLQIAQQVPGFDIIMMGHDHIPYCEKIVNIAGDSVLLVNPGHNGMKVADISMKLHRVDGQITGKQLKGALVEMDSIEPDKAFLEKFNSAHQTIQQFVSKKIGVFTETITTRPAYFGSSAFVDFIHELQLDISGADISFASPLSFDAQIERGNVRIGDMFKLYKYKNLIYTMELTGKEIRNYLEESYGIWTQQMTSPEDHMLLLKNSTYGGKEQFANMYYYFDSAAGIIYTVDVTKEKGEKVNILCMSDGRPFYEDKLYDVALTSYRGNGGGELLTKGAGISVDELDNRIKTISENDFRYYLINYIKENKVIHPRELNHWKFIPEDWVTIATEKDYQYLFGEKD
ncbi:bifunctional metallophosphatase/5'-nucleotidase [Parabacteroides sp. PFB2-10]|uniref:bifunctional metallophosphatase/5'-nucleotidase n=1 Tax=Parabacteroides sp. PFB2-10 TaxID=1742405 RepID=UPI0032AF2E12